MTNLMKLYYIAYQYQSGLEMISGPFGTASEAYRARDSMIAKKMSDDENLKVVADFKEVVVL